MTVSVVEIRCNPWAQVSFPNLMKCNFQDKSSQKSQSFCLNDTPNLYCEQLQQTFLTRGQRPNSPSNWLRDKQSVLIGRWSKYEAAIRDERSRQVVTRPRGADNWTPHIQHHFSQNHNQKAPCAPQTKHPKMLLDI